MFQLYSGHSQFCLPLEASCLVHSQKQTDLELLQEPLALHLQFPISLKFEFFAIQL